MSKGRKRSICDFENEADLRANLSGSPRDVDGTDWFSPIVDPETTIPQSMSTEVARLQVLKSYAILDTEAEAMFDRLTRLASRLFRTPIALVSLVDLGRQWFKSSVGLDAKETSRRIAFCTHAILSKQRVMVVPDASIDFRFQSNPLVTGPPNIRFYAGAPLVSPEGYKLGTFCIIDSVARPNGLSDDDAVSLQDLAASAVQLMVDRRERLKQVCPETLIAATAHDLITPLTAVQLSLSLLKEGEKNLSAHANDLVDTALVSAKLMAGICRTTLDTMRKSNIEGPVEEGIARADFGNVVQLKELVRNLRTIIEPIHKKVPFAISVDPTLSAIVADGLCLFRSCLNLLVNAIERTNEGCVRLMIQKSEDGESVVFECRDNGPGLKLGDSPDEFAAGQESDDLRMEALASHVKELDGKYGQESKTEGSLHCSIVWFKIILKLPSGANVAAADLRRQVVSESPSPLFAELPKQPNFSAFQIANDSPVTEALVLSPDAMITSPDADQSQAKGPGERRRRALVVDDSKVIRKVIGRALSNQGFDVSYACDGLEGLQQLKATLFDLTLMDFLMPNLDGVECVRQYREWEQQRHPTLRQFIVGISAHADVKDQNLGLEAGMDGFRPKPVTVATLKEIDGDERLRAFTKLIDQLEFESSPSSKVGVDESANAALIALNVSDQSYAVILDLLQNKGVSTTIVNDSSSCLHALRKRSWSLVMIDGNFREDSSAIVSSFREWEKANRVNRQRHVFLVCNSPIPSPRDVNSAVQPPLGFNGVLPKPVSWEDVNFLLLNNQQTSVGDVDVQFKG